MKTKLVIIACVIVHLLKAQHIIEYDFVAGNSLSLIKHQDSEFKTRTTVEAGESCTFMIKNVNTFLYKVEVNGNVVDLHGEPPEAFVFFFNAKNFANLSGNLTSQELVESNMKKDSLQRNDSISPSEIYQEYLDNIYDALVKLEQWKVKYDGLMNIVQTDGLTGDSIIYLVNQYIGNKQPLTIIEKGSEDLQTVEKVISEFLKAAEKMKAANAKVGKNEEIVISDAILDDDLKRIKELSENIQKFNYPAFFNKFSILLKQATNPKSYYVNSVPVFASQDYIKFHISITPREDLKYAQLLQAIEFEYPIRVTRGIKIDYSTGLFFSFDEARGRTYRLDPLSGDTASVFVMHNTPNAVALPALGAAIHGSWRFNPAFAAGGMLGLGLNSTTITDANFYVGLSGIFGWEERFILNAGYAFNRVDYLKENYYVGQVLNKNAVSANELTAKTLRGGLFIGLTFNLSNKKKEGDATGSK